MSIGDVKRCVSKQKEYKRPNRLEVERYRRKTWGGMTIFMELVPDGRELGEGKIKIIFFLMPYYLRKKKNGLLLHMLFV